MRQLGTSGSGNHFVEFGLFTAHNKINGLEAGAYVALLSHSGSRGTGAVVCDHYSKIAFQPVSGFAERVEAARVVVAGFAGGPGILERDGS